MTFIKGMITDYGKVHKFWLQKHVWLLWKYCLPSNEQRIFCVVQFAFQKLKWIATSWHVHSADAPVTREFLRHTRRETWQQLVTALFRWQGTLCGKIVEASDSESKESWSSSKPIRNCFLRVWKASIIKKCISSILTISSPNFPKDPSPFGRPTRCSSPVAISTWVLEICFERSFGNYEGPLEITPHGQTSVEMVNLAY